MRTSVDGIQGRNLAQLERGDIRLLFIAPHVGRTTDRFDIRPDVRSMMAHQPRITSAGAVDANTDGTRL